MFVTLKMWSYRVPKWRPERRSDQLGYHPVRLGWRSDQLERLPVRPGWHIGKLKAVLHYNQRKRRLAAKVEYAGTLV